MTMSIPPTVVGHYDVSTPAPHVSVVKSMDVGGSASTTRRKEPAVSGTLTCRSSWTARSLRTRLDARRGKPVETGRRGARQGGVLRPGHGTAPKKFTDDYDATIRQVISATAGAVPFNITLLAEPPKEEDESKDGEK